VAKTTKIDTVNVPLSYPVGWDSVDGGALPNGHDVEFDPTADIIYASEVDQWWMTLDADVKMKLMCDKLNADEAAQQWAVHWHVWPSASRTRAPEVKTKTVRGRQNAIALIDKLYDEKEVRGWMNRLPE
jgi:hypothetical protein